MYFEGIFFCFCLLEFNVIHLFCLVKWGLSYVNQWKITPDLRFAVSIQLTERNMHAFKQKCIYQLILCE